MKISENVSLKSLNTFGVNVSARYFGELNTLDDVGELVSWRQLHDLPCLLLGGGSNLLFRDDFPGLVALISINGRELLFRDEDEIYVRAGAGENWHKFVRWTIGRGLEGLENLSLIPGTVGAAPVQNIGAYGVELKDRFHSLEAVDLDAGEVRTFDLKACQFAYRDSFFKSVEPGRYLITSVTFRLPMEPQWVTSYAGIEEALEDREPTAELISDIVMDIRRSKLPDPGNAGNAGNAGSFFKNPVINETLWRKLKQQYPEMPGYPQAAGAIKSSAAWLIDQCGWKGFRSGDTGVSPKHALVLVNYGSASGADIWSLAESIIASVEETFGIRLEPEPKVL